MQKDTKSAKDIDTTVELSGAYDEVVAVLSEPDSEGAELGPLVDDLTVVLETVERINGGTRSRVASNLPDEMAVPADAEEVVALLRVLERYDLVHLDGNTWKPGTTAEQA